MAINRTLKQDWQDNRSNWGYKQERLAIGTLVATKKGYKSLDQLLLDVNQCIIDNQDYICEELNCEICISSITKASMKDIRLWVKQQDLVPVWIRFCKNETTNNYYIGTVAQGQDCNVTPKSISRDILAQINQNSSDQWSWVDHACVLAFVNSDYILNAELIIGNLLANHKLFKNKFIDPYSHRNWSPSDKNHTI